MTFGDSHGPPLHRELRRAGRAPCEVGAGGPPGQVGVLVQQEPEARMVGSPIPLQDRLPGGSARREGKGTGSRRSPRDKTGVAGSRGGTTGPEIVAELTGRAAGHVHGRAAHTCRCPSRPALGKPAGAAGRSGAARLPGQTHHRQRQGTCPVSSPRNSGVDATPGGPARGPSAWAVSYGDLGSPES